MRYPYKLNDQQIQKIMEVFEVDMLTASRVIQIYNKHIKK